MEDTRVNFTQFQLRYTGVVEIRFNFNSKTGTLDLFINCFDIQGLSLQTDPVCKAKIRVK